MTEPNHDVRIFTSDGTAFYRRRPRRMEIEMIKKTALVLVLASMTLVAACNTVKGAGRDIESVGQTGEKVIN